MTQYYIFKTNNLTNKTCLVCCGSHDTEEQCRIHWTAYIYGFMDGCNELLGYGKYGMTDGEHELSFRLEYKGDADVEYFMLLGGEGQQLVYDLCKTK